MSYREAKELIEGEYAWSDNYPESMCAAAKHYGISIKNIEIRARKDKK
jgi:hypothetical protein